VLSGVGRPDITTKIVLGVAAVNLVGNVILVQSFGMVGISVMTLISFLLAFLASFAFTRKLTSTALGWTALLKSVAAGLSMLLVIFGIKTLLLPIDVWLTIVVSLIVGLVAYFAVLLRLRAISESELELLAGLAVPIPKTVFGAAKMLLSSK
jgi:stage V sporulation protein B